MSSRIRTQDVVGGNSQARIEGWGQEMRGCRDGDRGLDLARRAENPKNLGRALPLEPISFFKNQTGWPSL